MSSIELNDFKTLDKMFESSGDKIQVCGNENIISIVDKNNHSELTIGLPLEVARALKKGNKDILLYLIDVIEYNKLKEQ